MSNTQHDEKTFIGVLASHDDDNANNKLAILFDKLIECDPQRLKRFRFVFTGGTFDRVILGTQRPRIKPVNTASKAFLSKECGLIRLPTRSEGGVTVLAYLITQRRISIIWPFMTPLTVHWLNPENLALLRLCDNWHVKKLMNTGSVTEWFLREADRDIKRNLQGWPLKLRLGGSGTDIPIESIGDESYQIKSVEPAPFPQQFTGWIIALIAHDEMKNRMEDFAIDYEHELGLFQRILSTGTTGRLVGEAAPTLEEKIFRYHSGPKGGDIEIATEILFGGCHVVIFFLDPLHPHPHIEDIRVVFGACMIQDGVRMLSNEMQAREWIDRVVRGR